MSDFHEEDHPRDDGGKFAKKGGTHNTYSNLPDPQKIADSALKHRRVKVAELTSPIYNNMVLSTGRKVKDIVTRALELPLTSSAGAEHIASHNERKGMVEHYIWFMSDIVNDPDYVFEDKKQVDTIVIEKEIDKHILMVVKLNFDYSNYTNSIITFRNEDTDSFIRTMESYNKTGKLLYKKKKT